MDIGFLTSLVWKDFIVGQKVVLYRAAIHPVTNAWFVETKSRNIYEAECYGQSWTAGPAAVDCERFVSVRIR